MDENKAIAQVIAAYEKLIAESPRIQTLEKKLADGTITMKEGAELTDLLARAFGTAFSGKVLDIAQNERESTCTALLREGCNDVDELAQAAQRADLGRQGLNLTPPTAPFEEDRARKIGHSLEDQTVPDETIQRRARSATENMLKSQYDRNMKQGAKTCAEAGLKTYIIRDSGRGCCKWCDEVAGKFVYGTEPKDVYRRHDNCSCSVVYESGRGRQNVWSKQYWSAEQEKEYLRLRDEMAPKRLNARQAQALRERVGGLTINPIKGSQEIEFTQVNNAGKVDKRLLQEYREDYDKFAAVFGNLSLLKGFNVLPYNGGKTLGYYEPNSREIFLLGIGGAGGKAFITAYAKEEKKTGMWSTASPYHTFRHELGHSLQAQLQASDPEWAAKKDKIQKLFDEHQKALTNLSDNDRIEYMTKTLSRYGFDDLGEFISESVAEYINSPKKARKNAKTVAEIILGEGAD